MKNRYIPFGYQIQNGDSVINTEQAATVQHIWPQTLPMKLLHNLTVFSVK